MAVFLILWLVWAALLFGGFIFGKPNPEATRRMPAWTRMASSVTLVIFAWLWLITNLTQPAENLPDLNFYKLCIAIGMTFGCLGDFFMAQLIPVKQYVLAGMTSFGLGHVAYIFGFLSVNEIAGRSAQPVIVIIWLMIAVILWYLIVFRGSDKSTLHYAALPYSLLLAATAGIATMRAFQSPLFILPAVGAALFLLSDLILATRLFNHARFYLIDDVVWLTYGPGQMLIVCGTLPYLLSLPVPAVS